MFVRNLAASHPTETGLLGLIIPLTNPIKGLFKGFEGMIAHVGLTHSTAAPSENSLDSGLAVIRMSA